MTKANAAFLNFNFLLYPSYQVVYALSGFAEEDMTYLAQTVHFEQTARLRKAGQLTALTAHSNKFDLPRLLKAVLVRRDVYRHIAMTFARMEHIVSE